LTHNGNLVGLGSMTQVVYKECTEFITLALTTKRDIQAIESGVNIYLRLIE